MSYRIKISIYEDSRCTGLSELKYSEVAIFDLRASEIMNMIHWTEGYSCAIVDGDVLSFFDFRCIDRPSDDIINLVRSIPKSKEIPVIAPRGRGLFIIEDGDDGTYQPPETCPENTEISVNSQTQCGAGAGFGQSIIWLPLLEIIRDGIIWDLIKRTACKLFGIMKECNEEMKTYIQFSPRKVYQKASAILQIPLNDLQIITIKRIRNGEHKVIIRTINDERYELKVTSRGEIISIKSAKE